MPLLFTDARNVWLLGREEDIVIGWRNISVIGEIPYCQLQCRASPANAGDGDLSIYSAAARLRITKIAQDYKFAAAP